MSKEFVRDNKTVSSQLVLPPEATKSQYNDAKIRSEEIIMTQPKCTFPFFEEETAVKYEPWEMQDLVDGGDDDSYLRNDYYGGTSREQSAVAVMDWSITNGVNGLTDKLNGNRLKVTLRLLRRKISRMTTKDRIQKVGCVYGETMTCVETDANEVKIEHLVYSLESRDEDGNPFLINEQLLHLTEERTSQQSILHYKNEPEITRFSTVQEPRRRERKQKHRTDEEEIECVVAAPAAIIVDEPEIIKCPFVEVPPPILSISKSKVKRIQKSDIDGNIFPRPAFPYSCLIAMALKNSLNGSLPVSKIYKFICYHFPYFKTAPRGWKNSVRHILSMHRCFNKITKKGHIAGRRCLWALNPDPARIHKMDKEIQKFSERDPVAIRRAMFEPENMEKIIRGELKGDFCDNGASDEDKGNGTSLPPVKKQSHRSRTNYLDSFSADTIIIPTNTATIIVSDNLATPHRPNILGNIASRPLK